MRTPTGPGLIPVRVGVSHVERRNWLLAAIDLLLPCVGGNPYGARATAYL
jgi:hypothetical protein